MSKNKWPIISVVTPSYNQGKFIERTIKSVLDQNYPNLEYWVIDGGSTDNTIQILKKYEDNLNWISEPDKGQADAINKGLQRSTGEILAYLNSDDTYLPDSLKKVAEFFTTHPEANILVGKGKLIDENDKYIGDYHNAPMDWSQPQPTCSVCQPAVFWRKAVYRQVGRFEKYLHYAMDYDYWLRVSKENVYFYLDDYLASARIHPQAKTSLGQERLAKEMIMIQNQQYGYSHQLWILQHCSQRLLKTYPPDSYMYKMLIIGWSCGEIIRDGQWPNKVTWRKYGFWLKQMLGR